MFNDFNKLHTFTIAAKHLSFSKASEELFITQAAVSQQIRGLEQRLGFSLFDRLTRKIRLTHKGNILFNSTNEPLDNIKKTVYELKQMESSDVLTVAILPSLAMKWLIPRLERFNQKHPKINVHVYANTELTDFKKNDADLAIRYAYKSDKNMIAIPLMQEETFLVASPNIITKNKPLNKPNDLKHCVIIHDETGCIYEIDGVLKDFTWQDFGQFLGVDINNNRSLRFTEAHLVLQAAIAGQGVAIARSALVEDDLKTGKLVKVFPDKIIKSPGYHIIYPNSQKKSMKIEHFVNWLLSEVGEV